MFSLVDIYQGFEGRFYFCLEAYLQLGTSKLIYCP
jgi:hypothetical protein